jgi:WD40 repeat protein
MILGLEIGMLIAGLIALTTGKFRLFGKRAAHGAAARVGGFILLLPLPLSFCVGFVIGAEAAASGKTTSLDDLRTSLALLEGAIALGCLILGMIIASLGSSGTEDREARAGRRAPGVAAEPLGAPPVFPGFPAPEEASPPLALPVEAVQTAPARRAVPPGPPTPAVPFPDRPSPAPRAAGGGSAGWVVAGVLGAVLVLVVGGGAVFWVLSSSTSVPNSPRATVPPPAGGPRGQGDESPERKRALEEARRRQEAREAEERRRLEEAEAAAARARVEAEEARRQAEEARRRLEDEQRKARVGEYATALSAAARELQGGDVGRAVQLLDGCPPEFRGWEWRHLRQRADGCLLSVRIRSRVGQMLFRPNSGEIIVAVPPNDLVVFDARAGEQRAVLKHPTGIGRLAVSPDGKRLAVAGLPVRVWDLEKRELVEAFGQTNWPGFEVAFSPDGKRLATASARSGECFIKVWDFEQMKEVFGAGPERPAPSGLAFSADGKRLSAFYTHDPLVQVWDLETTKVEKNPANVPAWEFFSPDGSRVAAFTGEGLAVWDRAGGKRLCDTRGQEFRVRHALAFHPDGKTLVCVDKKGSFCFFNAETGALNKVQPGKRGWVNSLAFSSDGRLLASLGFDPDDRRHDGYDLRVWATEPVPEVRVLGGGSGPVRALAFSPDGTRLATAHGDRSVAVWDVDSGEKRGTLVGHAEDPHGLAWSPDGKSLASVAGATPTEGAGPGEVKVWDVGTGKERLALKGHTFPVLGVAWCWDNDRLLTCGGMVGSSPRPALGEILLWDADAGKVVRRAEEPGAVFCLAPAPGWRRMVSGGFARPRAEVKLRTEDLERTDETFGLGSGCHGFSRVAVNHREDRIAGVDFAGRLRLLDASSGKELYQIAVWKSEPPREDGGITDAAFSPDGKRLAVAGKDAVVRLYDVETGKEVFSFPGHSGPVTRVAFSRDGTRLAAASGGERGEVRVWRAPPAREE